MTTKECRRCSTAFFPTRPNQQYCSPGCSLSSRTEKEKISRNKNKESRALNENAPIGSSPTSKQVGRPRTGHTKFKNEYNSIQEACNHTEGGKVTIIDISKDLPETLSNWDSFVCAYYSRVGTVIKFVKIGDARWSILNETERESWTVGKWSKWFNSMREKEDKSEAFHLVDIPVQTIHVQKLRENPLIDAFSCGGKFCLTQYIRKYSEDIPTPDLKYKAFIAPPWGNVMTFPHKDGFGTQLSVHCCIIGSGYNLVHYWPILNSSQDMIFRQVTNLPPTGTKQKVPHKLDFTVDASNEVWDAELERLLIEEGISSNSVHVAPGQAIILPPDQYHCFKKIFRAQEGTPLVPLVGLACDTTYVGATEESFNSHYQSIKAIQRAHNWPNHIFCILELTLFCLFQSLISLPSMMSDATFSAHVRGAYPRFVSWVQSQIKDAKRAMELIKCTEDDIRPIEDYEDDLFCHECKFPIVNVFVMAKDGDDEGELCINCLFSPRKNDNQKKKIGSANKSESTEYQLKCRFASPNALEHLLKNVKKLLGEEEIPSPDITVEITPEVVPGIVLPDQAGVDQPQHHEKVEDRQLLDDFLKEKANSALDSSTGSSPGNVRKPLKVHYKEASNSDISEESPKPLSLFGVSINRNKRKSATEASDAGPEKKKLKIDSTPPASGPRLSDQTINDYLDRRKMTSTKFTATYVFSTYYYEQFEVGGRSAKWSSPNLFDYQLLVIPIFLRQMEHWRLAILTNPRGLVASENKATNSPSGLFVFDSYYDTALIAPEITEIVLRILWKNWLKSNPRTDLSTLADKNLVVYPMQTCRQSNNVDCGVFMLHFIDEFVEFNGSDEEQYRRADWTIPLDVEDKRREILNTLNERTDRKDIHDVHVDYMADLFIGVRVAQTESGSASDEASGNDNPLFNEKNPRFRFNVYPPDEQDMESLQTPKGLISAPILDHYLSALHYDTSQFLIVPAHYSDMIASCDTEIISEFPSLITSKYILLPVHRNKHWVLLIITDVASVLHTQHAHQSSCNVFLLDSYHEYRLEADFFFDLAKKLLSTAVKIHAKKKSSFNAKKIVFTSLPVVQQTNGYDCGVFLLHNVETFVKSPFSSVEQFNSDQLWKKAFKPKVKRKQLFDKIASTLADK